MNLLERLNEPQRQAVTHIDGPLLILAGPGSGKTRVITHRIAYLIENHVHPSSILALTFTNKAAQEMAERVKQLTNRSTQWISTFHSFCSKILRRECEVLGYRPDFTIYDTEDQKRAFKQVFTELNIDASLGVNKFIYPISQYKNNCILPDQVPHSGNYWHRLVQKVYRAYQDLLKRNNAFDFDDLLLKTVELFDNYNDVLQSYQAKFLYILIDEFQDTNLPQYKIAKALAGERKNICATGDPDQSIYSWRGANIQNILNFEKDFENAVTIKLEQNYRSTQTILKAAGELIANNRLRKPKELWTDNQLGDSISLVVAFNDRHEAEVVCKKIQALSRYRDLSEMVIFYRMNSQSRHLETVLRDLKIPYTIVGGIEFYQRAEIKDLIAYLRVLVNPYDEISLLRIINIPARAIGKTTVEKLIQVARDRDTAIIEVLAQKELLAQEFKSRPNNALRKFYLLITQLQQQKSIMPLSEFVEKVLVETEYVEKYLKKNDEQNQERQENIKEFLTSVREYEKAAKKPSLSDFLERISLISDSLNTAEKGSCLTLMTLHAAKGLEFPIVFIVGLAEGVCPHSRSETDEELEEERRLLFVGMTRAKELLYLSFSKSSYRQGMYEYFNKPSRFLEEIPTEIIYR